MLSCTIWARLDPSAGDEHLTLTALRSMSSPNRVLVVDDDPDICDVLERFLSALGCRVETATDGEEALEALLREPPDLLLLDLELPGLSGLELLGRLKAEDLAVTVITMSGHPVAERHLGPKSVEMGASDFIMKPLDLDQLEDTLLAKLEALDRE